MVTGSQIAIVYADTQDKTGVDKKFNEAL